MSTASPAVTVLMAVYNGLPFLKESLESVFNQTFSDFELLVIDDASTDGSAELLSSLTDPRVRVLTNEKNVGLAASLNRGLSEARGSLIARMDADDVCSPNRLQTQYDFMQKKPHIGVCGALIQIYETGQKIPYYRNNDTLRAYLLFNCCVAHPVVMYRKDVILSVGGYNESMPPAEDYDLWSRLLLERTVQFANIPEVLLRYRSHSDANRDAYHEKQNAVADSVRIKIFQHLGINPSTEELHVHGFFSDARPIYALKKWKDVKNWKAKLLQANAKKPLVNTDELASILDTKCPNIFFFYYAITLKKFCYTHFPTSLWKFLSKVKKYAIVKLQ